MLAILWLIVWATVAEAFYDDYNWYTSDDGIISERAFESQRLVRDNLTNILRSFAKTYNPTREGDEELTMAKVKSRLRDLRVFKHTGSPKDFEPNRGLSLPLQEGGKYCTMGRYTKVGCNLCTCVAGQLYMCTGMMCTQAQEKPQEPVKCKEGKRRKIDSCNYCYCRNGHEICSTKDCRQKHSQALMRSKYTCREGVRRKKDCNRCLCRNGEEFCTANTCTNVSKSDNMKKSSHSATNVKKKRPSELQHDRYWSYMSGHPCSHGQILEVDCKICQCKHNHWRCSQPIFCDSKNKPEKENSTKCKDGTTRQKDACNTCYCRLGQELCEQKDCSTEENLPKRLNGRPCRNGKILEIDCTFCKCKHNRWRCSEPIFCDWGKRHEKDHSTKCSEGSIRQIDACNKCYCHFGQELCEKKHCSTEENLRFYRLLRNGERQCVEGSYNKVDSCNYCICLNGTEMCTRKLCPENSATKCTKGSAHFQVQVDPCNYCTCKDGVYVCTNNLCTERFTYTSAKEECNRWDVKYEKCNRCQCLSNRWVCTQKLCIGSSGKESETEATRGLRNDNNFSLRYSLDDECDVGEILQRPDDCQYCRCTYRKKWKCTENDCPNDNNYRRLLRQKMEPCIDGSRRQVNACNYCDCHNGVEFCTQKPCWGARTSMIFSEPECLLGEPVPAADPCNLCICLNSDILCTNNPCFRRKSGQRKRKCVENHKYQLPDNCNFCICRNGEEFCTNKACLTPDGTLFLKPDCKEGSVHPAKDGCNICICKRGKISCTNKDCSEMGLRSKLLPEDAKNLLSYIRMRNKHDRKHKMIQGSKQKCSPGKMYIPEDFDANCPNECICDRDEILCTKRKCYDNNNWNKHTPFNWPVGRVEVSNRNMKNPFTQEQPCQEFEPLPSDDICNTCMCLNERKVCTIVSCGDDFDDSDDALIKKIIEINGVKSKKKKRTFCEPLTFFSPDSNRFCRNCFCLYNGLALCLLNLCKYSKDIPHQNSPEELDEVCNPGEIGYPTRCVSCTCSETAKWICTREDLALCQERDCDVKDEFRMGFLTYCAGCKCAVKEWFCSIQSESCTDYSNVTCPAGTFIYNPRQRCSICLCGGNEEGSHNMCFTEAKCVRQVGSHLRI